MWGWVDGAECPAHIAVRSAPDPTLDMDLRVGNFLKGSFTIFLFFVRTHILDSNEVWYS